MSDDTLLECSSNSPSSYLKFLSKWPPRHEIHSKCRGAGLHIFPRTSLGPRLWTSRVLWQCCSGMAFPPWPSPVASLTVRSRDCCPGGSEKKKGGKYEIYPLVFFHLSLDVFGIFHLLLFVLLRDPRHNDKGKKRIEWNKIIKTLFENMSLTTHIFYWMCIYATITAVYLFICLSV